MIDETEDFGCVSPETLKATLQYLYEEAVQAGLHEPAHFIAVAAGSCLDLERRLGKNAATEPPRKARAASEIGAP